MFNQINSDDSKSSNKLNGNFIFNGVNYNPVSKFSYINSYCAYSWRCLKYWC
jgi:hypothetical protein